MYALTFALMASSPDEYALQAGQWLQAQIPQWWGGFLRMPRMGHLARCSLLARSGILAAAYVFLCVCLVIPPYFLALVYRHSW